MKRAPSARTEGDERATENRRRRRNRSRRHGDARASGRARLRARPRVRVGALGRIAPRRTATTSCSSRRRPPRRSAPATSTSSSSRSGRRRAGSSFPSPLRPARSASTSPPPTGSSTAIPLVVPEVNGGRALEALERDRIVANPNCCTIPLTCVLKPLHDEAGLARVQGLDVPVGVRRGRPPDDGARRASRRPTTTC